MLGGQVPLEVEDATTAHGPAEVAAALAAAQSGAEVPLVVLPAGAVDTVLHVLDDGAVRRATLVLMGTGDAAARTTLEEVPWRSWPRVRSVDLEYVPPRVVEDGPGHPRLVGGVGLVLLDADEQEWTEPATPPVAVARLIPRLSSPALPPRIAAQELGAARAELAALRAQTAELDGERLRRERAEGLVTALQSSLSWRVTAPLRAAKRTTLRNGR